MDNAVSSL